MSSHFWDTERATNRWPGPGKPIAAFSFVELLFTFRAKVSGHR